MSKKLAKLATLCVLLLASLLVVRAAGRAYLSAVETESARAVAELERTEWDFGTVSAGSDIRASFPIRNVGGRRLILVEQSRSCGCLSTQEPEIIVPPGGSRDLEILLKTSQLDGSVRKHVQYGSNDPELPTFTLTLIAEVEGRSSHAAGPVSGP